MARTTREERSKKYSARKSKIVIGQRTKHNVRFKLSQKVNSRCITRLKEEDCRGGGSGVLDPIVFWPELYGTISHQITKSI